MRYAPSYGRVAQIKKEKELWQIREKRIVAARLIRRYRNEIRENLAKWPATARESNCYLRGFINGMLVMVGSMGRSLPAWMWRKPSARANVDRDSCIHV